jgi:hypothetical protein
MALRTSLRHDRSLPLIRVCNLRTQTAASRARMGISTISLLHIHASFPFVQCPACFWDPNSPTIVADGMSPTRCNPNTTAHDKFQQVLTIRSSVKLMKTSFFQTFLSFSRGSQKLHVVNNAAYRSIFILNVYLNLRGNCVVDRSSNAKTCKAKTLFP